MQSCFRGQALNYPLYRDNSRAYLPKYGHLRLVVTKNRHGNDEVLATNDLDTDLTAIVLRKRSRWSVETLFRDAKQFSDLAARQCLRTRL